MGSSWGTNSIFRSPYFVPSVSSVTEEAEEMVMMQEENFEEEFLNPEAPLSVENEGKGDGSYNGQEGKTIGEEFSAFTDGSYRIENLGYLLGTPLYLACVTASLLVRKNKFLKSSGLNKRFWVVLFPFDAFMRRHETDKKVIKLLKDFWRGLKANFRAFQDIRFRQEDALKLVSRYEGDVWIYSDITYKGLKSLREDITPDDVMDEGKIFRRVTARVRVLMLILETLNFRFFRQVIEGNLYQEAPGKESWVLIDGPISNYRKFFCASVNQSEHMNMFNRAVGFIKNIHRYPNIEPEKLYRLKEGDFFVSLSYRDDLERVLREDLEEESLLGENRWGFVYMRLRLPFRLRARKFIFARQGLVKLQFRVSGSDERDEVLKRAFRVARLVFQERFPLPRDGRRLWKEVVGIEEAERVSKSALPSRELMRARLLSRM